MSTTVAGLAAVALLLAPAGARRAIAVVVLGVAAGWPAGEVDLRRYLSWPPEGSWSPAAVGGILGLFVAGAALAIQGNRPTARFTPALTVTVVGVYLCLPETGAIRLLPGPLVVASLGIVAGWYRPLGQPAVMAIAALAGWIALVDGQTRPSSVIGALGCISALLLLRRRSSTGTDRWSWVGPELPREHGSRWRYFVEPVVMVATVAACSRGAGLLGSTRTAAAVAAVSLATGWSVLRLVPAPPAR